MAKNNTTAIQPTRDEDYPSWYQQVIKVADLAETSPVRGCMTIKPWGWGIWEKVQKNLDQMIKDSGHENAYFPLFIPLSYIEKEASHIKGFAKECAVVTHHRLIEKDGKLEPDGKLEEPLIVRPTSETIIGEAFSRWIQSYRDLPLLINQWANVVRWEMRTRMFLRTAEFLWQEGHTAHSNKEEALEETLRMIHIYRDFAEQIAAIPVIVGEKSPLERFPGAEQTLTIEAMMQDGKALQAGTSHYLGTNFAKAQNIQYLDKKNNLQYAHTTSWGVSTRIIGGIIMVHGDDNGLRLPPKIAPKHIVILPVIPNDNIASKVFEYANKLKESLSALQFNNAPVEVIIDKRDLRGGEKNWQWIKKGIPLRIEVGPKDIEKKQCVLYRRDRPPKDKLFLPIEEIQQTAVNLLNDIQNNLYKNAKEFLDQHTVTNIVNFNELKEFFLAQKNSKQKAGFVLGKWSGDKEDEAKLIEIGVSIRCLPLQQSKQEGLCIISGKRATIDAIFAKAY